jgi:hypothetical protein
MSSDGLVSQRTVARSLGAARVIKLRRCGWLQPAISIKARPWPSLGPEDVSVVTENPQS